MANKVKKEDGTIFISGLLVESGKVGKSLSRLDISAIKPESILNHIPLLNCCGGKDHIGTAKLYKTEKGLMADCTVSGYYNERLYPAISGVIEEHHTDEFGIRVIDKFRITDVSLYNAFNDDANIKTLGEQLNEQ